MAVVFDEVVGTVVPPADATRAAEDAPAPAKAAAPGNALRELRRALRRAERVRAD